MRTTFLSVVALAMLTSTAGTHAANRDERMPTCAALGITHTHDMMEIQTEIVQAQERIRNFGAFGCFFENGSRLWFRKVDGCFVFRMMTIVDYMTF